MSNVRQRRPIHTPQDDQIEDEDERRSRDSGFWTHAAFVGLLTALILTPVILIIIPSPIDPVSYSFKPRPELVGPLEPNSHLQKSEHIYEGQVLGPESIVVEGEHIYTGTLDGKILHIYKGQVQVLAKFGKEPCGGFDNEPTCGRPLGMRLDKNGYLYVIDTYLGLYQVNVATGDFVLLWPTTAEINGRASKFLNDLTIASDGMIYMTDSSAKWDRRHNRYCIFEGEATGRLISYDPITNTTKELASGLAFANGVQISRNEEYLLICETTWARIFKYHLKGPKKGTMEVFMDNLPGLPDNIRLSSAGGYWIGIATLRSKGYEFMANKPWLRKLVAKIISQETIIKLVPKYGLILEISSEGEIIRSLHDPTATKVPSVSEVEDKDGVLYLGSYFLPHMSRLYLGRLKT